MSARKEAGQAQEANLKTVELAFLYFCVLPFWRSTLAPGSTPPATLGTILKTTDVSTSNSFESPLFLFRRCRGVYSAPFWGLIAPRRLIWLLGFPCFFGGVRCGDFGLCARGAKGLLDVERKGYSMHTLGPKSDSAGGIPCRGYCTCTLYHFSFVP